MEFVSSRGAGIRVSAAEAIVRGLAQDGGLFVPCGIPQVSLDFIDDLRALGYAQRAFRVLRPYLSEFSEPELMGITQKAYARFDVPEVALVRPMGQGRFALELWHGPTLAFKDMALQLMPHLLSACAQKIGEKREILILVATSGDTGKAALEGFMDVPGTRVCVFYPEDGVSEAQRLQMVTQEGANTHVIAVKGNFDDAQTGVKRIFSDAAFAAELAQRGVVLSSANSINLGRLLPQIVYYFSAYADLLNRGALTLGDPMDVVVPTGNFGNILAAHYARSMGLPMGRLICASNANNILYDFIRTGEYDSNRPFELTTSPSMDILISSNLERLLYELVGAQGVAELMGGLLGHGRYALDAVAHARLAALLDAGWADEGAVMRCIKQTFEADGYLIDPHTAVAVSVLDAVREAVPSVHPALVVSTASPYKFGRSVLCALKGTQPLQDDFACCRELERMSGAKLPEAILALPQKPVLHSRSCAPQDMLGALKDSVFA